jgi:serine/threonine-protein kinase HipA
MSTLAEIQLWGTTVGAISLGDGEAVAAFEYDASFLKSGIELSPIAMPLSRTVYRFPGLPREAFHGLPGLLADSLPDRFGNAIIDTWLARQGRLPASFNAVERLCYTGKRGMGALEFRPATGPDAGSARKIDMEKLVELASGVLAAREALSVSLKGVGDNDALKDILRVGTSAGGARAKAVIAWNQETNEVRSGQTDAPAGFAHWLLKFDGVSANRDKELADPAGYGAIEYAYYLMARAAGIRMSDCRILEENGRRHFMTRRFDRTEDGKKVHMQTLAAIAHLDFNAAGSVGYERLFSIIRQLGMGLDIVEEAFRRMAFNVVARNQDDHVKNTAFLMDRRGVWSLAPAYDVTYSFQPGGAWTGTHQMSLNGKRDAFTREDFREAGKSAGLKRGRAEAILDETISVISRWPDFAAEARVPEIRAAQIADTLRISSLTPR